MIFEVLTFLSEWNLAPVVKFFLPEEEGGGGWGGEFGGFRSRHDKIYLISTPYVNYGVIKGFLARKKDVPTQMKK